MKARLDGMVAQDKRHPRVKQVAGAPNITYSEGQKENGNVGMGKEEQVPGTGFQMANF